MLFEEAVNIYVRCPVNVSRDFNVRTLMLYVVICLKRCVYVITVI